MERSKLLRYISTRTPHAGSDDPFNNYDMRTEDFNPHSPCGE